MLRLVACGEGNVVLSEGGHKATCGMRKKATAQAILRPRLEEGMTFIMTLCGTGVVKMRAFSSLTKAKEWFISGLQFPAGSIRMRTLETIYLSISVFSDRLVCTPIDQLQPTFIVRTTGPHSTLALDLESGDVAMNIGQLSHLGIPVPHNQGDMFEDLSPYLQKSESNNGWTLKPLHPNPLAMCQAADLILYPGNVLEIQVAGTKEVKDTGAYIRLWLLPTDNTSLDSATKHNTCGNILHLERLSTEEWFLHIEPHEILILNRAESAVIDFITVSADISKMSLAFELYKVSLSVMRTGGGTRANRVPTKLSSSLLSPPKPHQKMHRRNRLLASPLQCNLNVDPRQASSTGHYLTAVETKPEHGWSEMIDRGGREKSRSPTPHSQNSENTDTTLIINDGQDSLANHKVGRLTSRDAGKPDVFPRTPQKSVNAKLKHLRLEILSYPIQESGEYSLPEETELKTVWQRDAHSLRTTYPSHPKSMVKIAGHPDGQSKANGVYQDGQTKANGVHQDGQTKANGVHQDGQTKANGVHQDDQTKDNGIDQDDEAKGTGAHRGGQPEGSRTIQEYSAQTDQVDDAHNGPSCDQNVQRLSSFRNTDTHHQTKVKKI